MKTEQPVLITSIKATAALTKNLFVGFNGAICEGSAKALGVCNADTAINEQAPVMCSGIAIVKTIEAISQGAIVYSNDVGLAASEGLYPQGYALDSASGADELICVLLV